MPELSYLKNGESLELRAECCLGCGACVEVCPHGVFELRASGRGKVAAILDRDLCMECGACALNCPASAISVSAGVGCAAAIIKGKLTGKAPSCDCGKSGVCC